MSPANQAKEFSSKYQLSAREMAALFGVSISLASSWLSEVSPTAPTTAMTIAIQNQDRIFEMLAKNRPSRILSPGQLEIYESWRDRDN